MANISDVIEKFILDALKTDDNIDLSRNELASFFNCAPSQINYVLATRFTTDRGFEVVSQRGGSGFIRLIKLDFDDNENLKDLIQNRLKEPIDFKSAKQIMENLQQCGVIEKNEEELILSAISPKSLANPINIDDKLRSQILKNVLIELLKRHH